MMGEMMKFPALPIGHYTYSQAQDHSEEVDRWLGLRTEEIEAGLRPVEGQNLWIGLPTRTLLTPYTEILEMLSRLRLLPGQTVVDLGAGYGRMGFVVGQHFPGVKFIGYEYVLARVEEARRCLNPWNFPDIRMEQANLADLAFSPAIADAYFLYDYGTREAIRKTLEDLRAIAARQPITVIGRGRASRDAIERETPWLSQVNRPEHHGNYTIYKS